MVANVFWSSTVTAYFVIGFTIDTMSTSCTPSWRTPVSRFRSARLTWPETNRQGVESSQAPATPVTALVPPGPVVTTATPRLLVILA